MKKHLFIIIALAATIFIGATAYYLLKETDIISNIKPADRQLVKVSVMTLCRSNLTYARTYVGKADASKESVVKSPFPGDITDITIKKGDFVRGSQVVVNLYAESVNTSLEIARASLLQAQDGYDRLTKVRANGSVPEVKIVEVETQLAKAKASVKAAEKSLEDCNIKAPFDGVVSDIFIEIGEKAGIGSPLLKITDIRLPNIKISVPENEIAGINIGDTAILEVPALNINNIKVFVTEKSVDAQSFSHSYQCTLATIDEVEGLMPGMAGKVVFAKSHDSHNIVIPASAIRTDRDGRYVWTVNESNTVSKTYITTGDFSGKGVIVSSGLDSGDRVVVEGVARISTGMVVETVEK